MLLMLVKIVMFIWMVIAWCTDNRFFILIGLVLVLIICLLLLYLKHNQDTNGIKLNLIGILHRISSISKRKLFRKRHLRKRKGKLSRKRKLYSGKRKINWLSCKKACWKVSLHVKIFNRKNKWKKWKWKKKLEENKLND